MTKFKKRKKYRISKVVILDMALIFFFTYILFNLYSKVTSDKLSEEEALELLRGIGKADSDIKLVDNLLSDYTKTDFEMMINILNEYGVDLKKVPLLAYKSGITNFTANLDTLNNYGYELDGSELEKFSATLYLTLPRYNEYSEYDVCDRIPDYYMCQRFVTYDDFKYDDFTENVTKEIANRNKKNEESKENNKWYKKVGKFVSDHKTAFIIGGISLVVVAGGATYIIIKKRRRSII